jgi:hypothetical protein
MAGAPTMSPPQSRLVMNSSRSFGLIWLGRQAEPTEDAPKALPESPEPRPGSEMLTASQNSARPGELQRSVT